MNKQELLNDYKNQEDKLLLAKVMDRLEFSKARNKIENTDFLNLYEQDLKGSIVFSNNKGNAKNHWYKICSLASTYK